MVISPVLSSEPASEGNPRSQIRTAASGATLSSKRVPPKVGNPPVADTRRVPGWARGLTQAGVTRVTNARLSEVVLGVVQPALVEHGFDRRAVRRAIEAVGQPPAPSDPQTTPSRLHQGRSVSAGQLGVGALSLHGGDPSPLHALPFLTEPPARAVFGYLAQGYLGPAPAVPLFLA